MQRVILAAGTAPLAAHWTLPPSSTADPYLQILFWSLNIPYYMWNHNLIKLHYDVLQDNSELLHCETKER